jgi:Galactose oxidase-like, Early set domain/Glyoxal oxidase N-terminus
MNIMRCATSLVVLVVALALNARAQTPAPVGGADAPTKGVFGEPVTWPIIAIHVVLLPDGRVMNFGTDEQGQQGGQYVYDVWDPQQGTGTAAHMVLPNTTSTDIFCAGQSVLAASGEVLITGGDLNQTEIFHPQTNAITTDTAMQYARWYPTIVALPAGEMLVLGGIEEAEETAAPTPEVFMQNVGWRTLWDATSDAAFGGIDNWNYPRSFVAPNGKVFVLGHDGNMFFLDAAGNGTITQLTQQTLGGRPSRSVASMDGESVALPTIMFAPGRLLSVRTQQKVVVVDLNGPQPVVTPTADISQRRYWSNATVLPNGKVLLTGGSAVANQLTGVAYAAEIWDPATGQWTLGANAAKARLYHSTALLLPDGSVLTAGGGASRPAPDLSREPQNMNAEIYYPPYLYDASGQPAARPSLVTAPGSVNLSLNQPFAVTVGSAAPISRVTLVRTGATTHSFDSGQRFLELGFTQAGQTLTITLPTINPNVAVPGYYMLFVFDQAGVPSVAKIIRVLS